ncbi:g5824 [Coccomyxa viridis]|uniref:G5824 protein n=1 Tax=Coccomyxa viridis TaxID=1274662 RepID=A0ABP1FYX5_9CHLO
MVQPSDSKDTLRYTGFLGAFAGVFVSVDEGLAAVFGPERTKRWRAFVAGALAGPAILLTGPKTRHDSLAIYILLRGITLLVRCGNKPNAPPAVRKLLTVTRLKHGDTALMCACTSQIGYSWICKPHTLPPTFVHFLNHHGGKELWFYKAAKELSERSWRGDPLAPLEALKGTEHEDTVATHPCEWAHEGETCTYSAFKFFPGAYLRALPVYLPVYVLPAILVHRKALLEKGGLQIWAKVLKGALRSSAFLGLYCTLCWRGACMGFQTTQSCSPPVIAASCWTGGLATLLEKKSRRMELAVYCLSRALESFALCLVDWGLVRRRDVPKRIDVLMFSAAAAAIMHCYSDGRGRHRDVFRSKYLNILDFVFGNTGVEQGAITHVPSTKDLLAAVPVDLIVDRQAWRQRAHLVSDSLAVGLEHLADGRFEGPDTPRASFEGQGAITEFASGALDLESGRYQADDRPSNSVDADSAASGSASQAQHRGFTFGRLLNRPSMPLQLSRQRTESDEAETPTSAWHPPGSKTKDLLSIQEPGSPLENISEADEIRWAARKSLEAER